MGEQVMVTGIKPTGVPHLGNYLGAIRPALAQATAGRAYMFIADYHALNTTVDAVTLRANSRSVAAAYLAAGLNPAQVTLYRQSAVPETFELAALLANITPKGVLNRSHAYKTIVDAARAEGRADVDASVNMGLFTYPLLMAADILIMNAATVPVGHDQHSHVEIAADLAERFNHRYGAGFTFAVPQATHAAETKVVVGTDGRKMSKSYANTLPLFGTATELRKATMRIVTDSTPVAEPKDLGATVLGRILAQVAEPEAYALMAARAAQGGVGYGEVKQVLFEMLDQVAAPLRERYVALMAPDSELDAVLRTGAGKARARATQIMLAVRRAVGID